MGYFNTLIQVAEDSPVACGVVPVARGGKKTVAAIQFDLLIEKPYHYTQEELLFEVFARHKEVPAAEAEAARAAFFAKSQPCLRTSPLAKSYGWGLHFDEAGRVALCPMESEAYQQFSAGGSGGLALVKAMRSRRG